MKVLVTGASGFIGSHVVRQLLDNGHEVYWTGSYSEENPIPEEVAADEPRLWVVGVSARDMMRRGGMIDNPLFAAKETIDGRPKLSFSGETPRYIEKIDAVCHLEAETNTTKRWVDYIEPNIATPLSLYSWAKNRGCDKFVWASSAAIYGERPKFLERSDPKYALKTNYGSSKWEMERTLGRLHSFYDRVFAFLRLCNVYGPGEDHKVASGMESMIRRILTNLIRGETVRLFKDGEQCRQWVHVHDAARAFVVAVESPSHMESARIINGLEQGTSFNELVRLCAEAVGVDPKVEYIDFPDGILRFQSYRELPGSLAYVQFDWKPEIRLKDGIRMYAEHLKGKV